MEANYLEYRTNTCLENWDALRKPWTLLYFSTFCVEYFGNSFDETESRASGWGAIIFGVVFELLFHLQKYNIISTRMAGPIICFLKVVYCVEIVVQGGTYKVYEAFPTMISIFYLFTIQITVDVWLMPLVMLCSHSFAIFRLFTTLDKVPLKVFPMFYVPILPFTLCWYKRVILQRKEFLLVKIKECTIQKLQQLFQAFPNKIVVTKSDSKGNNSISFTNNSNSDENIEKENFNFKEEICEL